MEAGDMSFSFACTPSSIVTHKVNSRTDKFDIFIFTSKHMDKNEYPLSLRNSSEIDFHSAPKLILALHPQSVNFRAFLLTWAN